MKTEKQKLRVAIVHDWLTGFAGADRVVDQIKKTFPDAPIYTLVYDPSRFPAYFQKYDIRTTYIQKIPFATKLYKNMLTLMPLAFESLDLTQYDLVISSCSSCSKGVITRSDAVHICYCHTPTRYLWDMYPVYLHNAGILKRILMPGMIHKMRLWDYQAASRVDHFISNSAYVAQRIQKYYRRKSDVIYPGVRMDTSAFEAQEDYYLVVSRFVRYKRIDLAIEACNRLKKRLVIIGDGDEYRSLKRIAGPTIEFKGNLSDDEIRVWYRKAKAFLFPGEEDFGITPIEAMSAGIPVLAYGRGGATETVVDGKTGLFFPEQTVESLCDCIVQFEEKGVAYTREEIRVHSQKFSEERFRNEIEQYCYEKLALQKEKYSR